MANSIKTKYNRNDIKSWIQFGIQNGYINQFKLKSNNKLTINPN